MSYQERPEAPAVYCALDTSTEPDYHRLSKLAASICAAPIAIITLVDEQRHWLQSISGLAIADVEGAVAFSREAIKTEQPLIIVDAQIDPRLSRNSLVTESPHLRFFCGVPIISAAGLVLGMLAVMDKIPRHLADEQVEGLTTLAQQVALNLELKRQQDSTEYIARERVRTILSAAATGIAVTDVSGLYLSCNPAYCNMLGYTETELLSKNFAVVIHHDDVPVAHASLQKLVSRELTHFTHEARCVKKDGSIVWVRASVSLLYSDDGSPNGIVAVTDDITLLKSTEKKARELTERLAATLENISDAFLTVDLEWNFTYINSEAERLLQHSRDELLGNNVWQIFSDARGSPFEHYYRQAMREGKKVYFEAYYDALETWFRINAYPSAEGLAIYFQDINHQRKAQEQLRLLETCVARMNDIILITEAGPIDEPGPPILFVNDAFVARTGYTRDEVLGRSPHFLRGSNSQKNELLRMTRAMEACQPVRAELTNCTKAGEEFWLEVDVFPIADENGTLTHWVAVERDITERKKTEQKIYESEERFKLIAKATTDAVWDWDMRLDTLWLSEGVQTLFRMLPGDTDPTINDWINCIHPEDKGRVLRHIRNLINSDVSSWSQDYRFLPKDGSCAYVQDRGFIIRAADGKAVRMVGGITDVTAVRRAEIEIARNNEHKQAQQLAEMASEAKSNFLAVMSHEIRTPISGVIGMVNVLRETVLKAHQAEMVEIIRDSAYSSLEIIDDILDFSKIEAGKLDIESAQLSLTDVVKSVCVMLDRLAQNKNVEFTVFTHPDMPDLVLGDSLRLRQILINLINNAIKFSSGLSRLGRVSLRCQVLKTSSTSVWIEFDVIDNGIGISAETMKFLFNPFVQADASTTRAFGGTGLGLSISRHLVELMHGEITVESEPDVGSRFSVQLPFTRVPDRISSNAIGFEAMPCVIIGDELSLARNFTDYLSAEGAAVTCFSDLETVRQTALQLLSPPSAGVWLWVVDCREDNLSIDRLRSFIPLKWHEYEIRWVVIGRGNRRKPRRESSDVVSIDGNILDRRSFLNAVAVAAGLVEEEVIPLRAGKQARAFLPPARETALQQNRLILVAEDNDTNQKVIVRELALLGYAADVVANGVEALNYWRSGNYAMLLTDLHMPEMDGYALAQAIRREERNDTFMPIIVLSANALRGEAERCYELGINDYLTKPVSLEKLQTALANWLPPSEAPVILHSARDVKQPSSNEVGLPTLNVRVLEALVGDDPEVVRDFLLDFRESARQMVDELKQLDIIGNRPGVAAIFHKLKSPARAVGALKLGESCALLEKLCNETGNDKIPNVANETSLMDSLQDFDREMILLEQHLSSFTQ